MATKSVIDPTQNVLDLVRAESHFRDVLRQADTRYQDDMRDAETRRLDDLAALRVQYETVIEKMRSDKIDSTAKLLAENQRETKTDLQVELRGLNQFRWETGGRGTGLNSAAGWVVSIVMAGLAIAALFYKN